MRVTREFIFRGRSSIGGWTRKQVELLGVQWPLIAGWIDRAVGSHISEENAQEFLDLRNTSKQMKRILKNKKSARLFERRDAERNQRDADLASIEHFRNNM